MNWDVCVIGAGAAGLVTAIECGRQKLNALLLDGREKFGAKILMSGGTRCNLTNREVTERDFSSESLRAVGWILKAFPSRSAVALFRELGTEVVLEASGKYFPATHSAQTVLECLVREVRRLGVSLEAPKKVTGLKYENGRFLCEGDGFSYAARTVVLCSGGLSYPSTGSDGSGYRLAGAFGHRLVPTSPALTPLVSGDPDFKELAGVSLPARLTLKSEGLARRVFEGDFLFTHFGFSGPVVLDVSRHWIRDREDGRKPALTAHFLPNMTADELRAGLTRAAASQPKVLLKNYLAKLMPARVAETLSRKAGVLPETPFHQLSKGSREAVVRTVTECPLKATGSLGYAKAEVTAGGVDLKEVCPRTLESRLRPGLYFAGEILDADGRIGGFNFQWAWSSGMVAARAIGAGLHAKK
ncbi:MAG: NAD(P)/FAD-dependent oxidoreductase [Candidatus Omnitrophica bacterium]|nr:NAD(P)/FAD-dependent oxidoreductase [Candidatus Omnitrophota bacterium]